MQVLSKADITKCNNKSCNIIQIKIHVYKLFQQLEEKVKLSEKDKKRYPFFLK
jgi:hypothetical protein